MTLRILVSAFACHPGGGSGLGGGEDILGWNLVKQIARFHQVWILTHPRNRGGIEAALQQDPLHNLQFHYVEMPRWLESVQRFQGGIQAYSYLWQVRAYFAARSLHQRFSFHAFHHVTYANDWMASFIGALLPVPFIRGPGGGAHRTPKGFLREYSLRGRFAEEVRTIGQWLFRRDPFFRLGQRRARAILVCNREAMEAMPPQWKRKAQLFPVNGVCSRDLNLTVSAVAGALGHGAGRQTQKFSVLSAGRLLRIKGFGLAIKAFKTFLDRCPEAEFTIIGDGPEHPRLKALVCYLELQSRVRFEKWMAREELLSKMASCDVFLFPSFRDGGGAVVVEAMAAGKPVICFDMAGPGMHVTNGCGIKVPPHSPEQAVREIAAGLERLYKNKESRSQMGRAARERAEKVYHWDRLGERLLDIYEQALDSELSKG